MSQVATENVVAVGQEETGVNLFERLERDFVIVCDGASRGARLVLDTGAIGAIREVANGAGEDIPGTRAEVQCQSACWTFKG